jgi:acetyl esterase
LVRDLVRESGLAFVFPYYTPAPEAQYPVQFEQIYTAYSWIAANGSTHGLKTDKFATIGDSVGGHAAIALAFLAAQRGGPKLAYQVLLYPVTDISHESSTYKEFVHGPYLEAETLRWMINAFSPNRNERIDILLSPLNAGKEELKKLPATLVVVAAVDPLRGEGIEFARKLQEAGVECALFRAEGTVHDFAMLNALDASATTHATIELAALKLKKALA